MKVLCLIFLLSYQEGEFTFRIETKGFDSVQECQTWIRRAPFYPMMKGVIGSSYECLMGGQDV